MNSVYKRRLLRARSQRRRGGMPWWLTGLLALFALGSICAAAAIGAVFAVYQSYAKDYVPIEDKLRQTNIGLTEIYDRGGPTSGVLLGSLTNSDAQLLEPVPLDQISRWVIQATISTEDNSFESNPGINLRGLARAAWENYTQGGIGSGTGGSSITQQLIKNVYICPNIGDEHTRCVTAARTIDRKLREITYALELEKDYTKDEILTWYLNQISYADRYVGIQAAAQGYFRKDAADLTLGEAALLAGVPAFPTEYHPRLNCVIDKEDPEGKACVVDGLGRTVVGGKAKQRQEDVLDLMVRHGRATREEADAARSEDIRVYGTTNPIKSAAFIDNQVEPRLVRMCEAGWLPKIEGSTDCSASVHAAGYRVTTTLDWKATERATQLIQEWIADGEAKKCECHNAAIVTIEPSTGQVTVYAPNRNPKEVLDERIAGDVDQLTEINQPGSSFKPAVYLTWFDVLGKAPLNIFWDTSPLTIEGVAITNPRSDVGYEGAGLISARAALGGSQNVGAFRAAQEAGVDNVIEMAKKLGITTLQQYFDPTWSSHADVTYGASIATGGANIRAIDMAYMNSVFANMGAMVGVETLAKTIDPKDLKSLFNSEGAEYDRAYKQYQDFNRGHLRLPGTRELDPIVVLQVQDIDGNVLFTQGEPQRRQVVDAGSVWLLNSIISDCTSRFIIWGCGGSNDDLRLDSFVDGVKIPTGVKTGTQQGFKSAAATLETWTNGYSRYAATALWVGNANNDEVRDGPGADYATANTTVRLFKNWMGEYHAMLKAQGVFTTPEGFDSLRPKNVALTDVETPATDRIYTNNGKDPPKFCEQTARGWVRTDVPFKSDCEAKDIDSRNGLLASDQTPAQFRVSKKFVKLPGFKADLAQELAKKTHIPIVPTEKSTGQVALAITNPTNGKTITANSDVVGSVQTSNVKAWKLEIGAGSNPTEWKTIGTGTTRVQNVVLGTIDLKDLKDGVYTIRLTAEDAVVVGLSTSVTVNVKKGPGTPTPTGTITPSPSPSATPTP
ncbi:MAG: transglycosylase domain-containing protein [Chloroflexi bacterium]|nr:transglycosylase domain-containing protein [Chloroflexota bacterium]